MKSAVLAALILAAGFSSALGQTAPRTLTMNGEGEVSAAPDSVTLSAGVTSQAPTAAAALAANSARMQSVFAAIKKLGVADKDMQTRNFSISPQMERAGQPAAACHRLPGQQQCQDPAGRCRQAWARRSMLWSPPAPIR